MNIFLTVPLLILMFLNIIYNIRVILKTSQDSKIIALIGTGLYFAWILQSVSEHLRMVSGQGVMLDKSLVYALFSSTAVYTFFCWVIRIFGSTSKFRHVQTPTVEQ